MIFSADFRIKLAPQITQAWNFWNGCISESVDVRNFFCNAFVMLWAWIL